MSKPSALALALGGIIGENAKQLGITQWLDTGIPELNKILSGSYDKGIPLGRLIEIFGPSSSGKTFIATMIMKAAQEAGGIAGFSDHERSFEPGLAESLGLNTDPNVGNFIYKRPLTFEESIAMAVTFCEQVRKQKLIPEDAPLVWVFDSVASMIPHEKLFDDKGNRRTAGDYNMRDKLALAAATSQSYPILAQFAEDYNMTVLLLNQIRTKPGVMFGDPTTTPGGNASEFYSSIRLSLGRSLITNGKKGDEKQVLGQEITSYTVKNKVSRPFMKAKHRVLFREGGGADVDVIGSTLDFVIRKGFLEKSSTGRIEWEGKKVTVNQLSVMLQSDPDAMKKLMALVPDTGDRVPEDVVESDIPTEPAGAETA